MESNFSFLAQWSDMKGYVATLSSAEDEYTRQNYDTVAITLRRAAENLLKDELNKRSLNSNHTFYDNLKTAQARSLFDSSVIDSFFKIKNVGNSAAHNLSSTNQKDAFDVLKSAFFLFVTVANKEKKFDVQSVKFAKPKADAFSLSTNYPTTERKVIYIQTADQEKGQWPEYKGLEKIGDATISDYETDNRQNSEDLRNAAETRVNQYMKTAGVPHVLQWAELAYSKALAKKNGGNGWFRDYDVHRVLDNSGVSKSEIGEGKEWYRTNLDVAKRAITAVKEGRTALDKVLIKPEIQEQISLRPEQRQAVKKTVEVFDAFDAKCEENKSRKNGDNEFLWNAKMRFGKTLTAFELVKEKGYRRTIIVTHRPIVDSGWFKDFQKIGLADLGYAYGSRQSAGHKSVEELEGLGKPYVYFASLQDLTGSEQVGGKVGIKNSDVFSTDWDLIIIDEAHEGTQTELAANVLQELTKPHTKILQLSGTPFNLLNNNDYDENHVFTWDYTMEQQAKQTWAVEHPDEPNPYEALPKVSMYTFELGKDFRDPQFRNTGLGAYAFNFAEFFRVDDNEKFVHEEDVNRFLDNISRPDSRNHYPFTTKEMRDNLRHTLWIMPSIKAANAMETLLCRHPVFGMDYSIVNVVRGDKSDQMEEANADDIAKVNAAITEHPAQTHSITLTVRKLTTGVTIPAWTGVLFLSNISSAMQYLQAAFRAQTPYSDSEFGQKTNCYIFDFAPDRALTVMAESVNLSTQAGKRNSKDQIDRMNALLNFLPIIGQDGNNMKRFSVSKLLTKIKQAYAERAVRSGFDDDSIYSDAFYTITDDDFSHFTKLKRSIGTTKRDKELNKKIDINHQGLDEEQYERAENAKKKQKDERTPEEQEALDRENALKERRRALISILRGISIRIPLMMYGMDISFDEDLSIEDFVDKVDDLSWKEFMPVGVSKDDFRGFIKFYDSEVFINAGRIIRQKVKDLDETDVHERVSKIAGIFQSFRNPDKETVLTPWKVVNLHMSETIGGWSHFDKSFESEFNEDGTPILRRTMTDYTAYVFNQDSKILEINAKTGLYPLYMAGSLFLDQEAELTKGNSDKVLTLTEQQELWRKILRQNIFVIAKTPMARKIAQRTLSGYHDDWETNIHYVEDIVQNIRKDVDEEVKKIQRIFRIMKFDVVIGNPPYQLTANGGSTRDEPIYHLFVDLAYKLADLVTFITPGRFLFDAGQTPSSWNSRMLSDPHLKVVKYWQQSSDVFPRTDIKGGVVVTLRDAHKKFGAINVFFTIPELHSLYRRVWGSHSAQSFSELISRRGIFHFTQKMFDDYPDLLSRIAGGTRNMIISNAFNNLSEVFEKERPKVGSNEYIQLLGRSGTKREYRYIKREYVVENPYIDCWKVFVPKANGSGALGEVLSTPLIGAPLIGATDTFLSIGPFTNKYEAEACLKYVKTKFARAMLGILKTTQDNPRSAWKYVPMQDFTERSDIDWSKSVGEIDRQLYKKYGLSQEEINFIESKVQEMK